MGAAAGSTGTTTATPSSPITSSGRGTTTTSRTSGWSASTASTSAGYTLYPPRMNISLVRPARRRLPRASIVPRSPVRSQPSVSVAAVPSSSRQYPAIAVGERSQTSPTPSAGAWMRTSMPPRGWPTVNSASSSSASKAVPVPQPPDSVDE